MEHHTFHINMCVGFINPLCSLAFRESNLDCSTKNKGVVGLSVKESFSYIACSFISYQFYAFVCNVRSPRSPPDRLALRPKTIFPVAHPTAACVCWVASTLATAVIAWFCCSVIGARYCYVVVKGSFWMVYFSVLLAPACALIYLFLSCV